MCPPKQQDNGNWKAKKHSRTMMGYTNVWSFKSNDEAKFEKFSYIIKAVLNSSHLLNDMLSEDNVDDSLFWETISKQLKTEHFISKKPVLLKKFFKSFYFKENHDEYMDKHDIVKTLHFQCIATYKFNKNHIITLNNDITPEPKQQVDTKEESPEKIIYPEQKKHILYKLLAKETSLNDSANSVTGNATEFFKKSAYALFSAETEHLQNQYVLKNDSPSIDKIKFDNIDGYKEASNTKTELCEMDTVLPDWVYAPNSQCNQYTHFDRFVAVKTHLERCYKKKDDDENENSN